VALFLNKIYNLSPERRIVGEMSKEHAGGSPDVGYEIPISSWDEDAYPVSIEQFRFQDLDKPEDFIIEAVKENRDIGPILKSLVNRVAAQRAAAMLTAFVCMVREAKKPRMIADQIVWATGMTLLEGASCEDLAKSYGVSKQAFVQGAHRVCDKLNLKPCHNMRDEKARASMSKRNFRRNE
jgi:hypothetical protein